MRNSRFKKNKIKYLIFLFINIGIIPYLHAQSIPIGQIGTDDFLRTSQLIGKIDHSYSLTIKPIYYNKVFNKLDSLPTIDSLFLDSLFKCLHDLIIIQLKKKALTMYIPKYVLDKEDKKILNNKTRLNNRINSDINSSTRKCLYLF